MPNSVACGLPLRSRKDTNACGQVESVSPQMEEVCVVRCGKGRQKGLSCFYSHHYNYFMSQTRVFPSHLTSQLKYTGRAYTCLFEVFICLAYLRPMLRVQVVIHMIQQRMPSGNVLVEARDIEKQTLGFKEVE
jgi:hypothetical protein